MNRLVSLIVSLIAAVAVRPGVALADKPARFGISAVRAQIYLHETGKLQDGDIADGQKALWNTIIGEGDAAGPSSTTFVFVELSGPAFVSGTGGQLEVVASVGKATLLKKKVPLEHYFSESPKVVVPFVVYGTGCDEVTVTATLKGVPKPKLGTAKVKTVIPFNCGE